MVDTSRLPISPEQAAAINPTLAVPVGLALPDPSGKPFNLLPAEIAAEYAKKRMRNMLIIAAAAVVVLLALLTVWRVLAVHSKENAVASLTAQKNYINNVEIPKYDKEVALRAQVQAQQAALVPLVAGETNFLIVLNQIGDYQTDPATLSNLTLTEVGATAAGTPSATTPAAASALPTSATIIATASGNLTVAALPQVTQWGLSMSQSPAFEGVSLGGSTLTPGNNLSFMGSWSINGNAHSERINLFDQPLPK